MSEVLLYLVVGSVYSWFYVKEKTPSEYRKGYFVPRGIFFLVCLVIWPVLLFIDVLIFVLKFLGKLFSGGPKAKT
ncbi:MAG: hypothetical protein Q8Q95_02475 [bacterium]|nr:hypothetical protein [bacterium]